MNDWLDELTEGGHFKILCGAGISLNSGVPLANQILRYIFKRVGFIKEDAERLINRNIPFEDWINLFITSRIHGEKLLGLFSAHELRPCENHRMIAKLVKNGAVHDVYTANFDTLIEQALIEEGLKADVDFKVLYEENQFEKIDSYKCARIVKFHGSAHDRNSIRITLHTITAQENLSNRFKAISPIFSQYGTENLLVMGYSCSDIWDVQPCMKSIPYPHAEVFYVKHTRDGTISDEKLEAWPTDDFTGYRGYKVFGETTQVLKTICEHFQIPTATEKEEPVRWEELMDKYMEPYFEWFTKGEDYKLARVRILQRISAYADAEDVLNSIDLQDSSFVFSRNIFHRKAENLMHLAQPQSAHSVYRQELIIRLIDLSLLVEEPFLATLLPIQLSQEDAYHEELFIELEKALNKREYDADAVIELTGAFLGDCSSLNDMGKEEVALKNLALLESFFHKFQRAVRILRSDSEADLFIASIFNEQGVSYYLMDNLPLARQALEKSIEIKRIHGDTNGIANSLNNLARVYAKQSDIELMRVAILEAVDLRLKLKHPQKTFEMINNSILLCLKTDSAELLETCIINAELFFAEHPEFRDELNPLFPLVIARFEKKEYQTVIEKMVDLVGDSLSDDNVSIVKKVGREIINTAKIQQSIGEYQKSLNSYGAACFLFKKIRYDEGVGGCLRCAGILYENSGQLETAMDYYTASLERMKNTSIQKARTLAQIGSYYGRRGEKDRGIQYTNDAIKMFSECNDSDSVRICKNQIAWLSSIA